MRKAVSLIVGSALAYMMTGSASAELVRYPVAGKPALIVSVPERWTHKPLGNGDHLETLVLSSPQHVEVAAIILPHVGALEAFAKQIAQYSHLTMQNSGPAQLLGRTGYKFDASYTDLKGAVIDMHVVQVTLDPAHLLLMELRSPRASKPSEIADGKRVFDSLKLEP